MVNYEKITRKHFTTDNSILRVKQGIVTFRERDFSEKSRTQDFASDSCKGVRHAKRDDARLSNSIQLTV